MRIDVIGRRRFRGVNLTFKEILMRATKGIILILAVFGAVCVGAAEKGPSAVSPFDVDEAKAYQKATAEFYGVPVEKSVDLGDGVKMDFVLIPAGEFHMGSSTVEAKRDRNEGPAHEVILSKPFYIGKFEVTQQQYKQVFGSTVFAQVDFEFKGDTLPAETVSGYEVEKFVKDLSKAQKKTFRLATEAEWEFACRAGTTTPFNFGVTITPENANYDGGTWVYPGGRKGLNMKRTVDVGLYPANAFGLHDMHGNVWEWCSDWWNSGYYKETPTKDPKGPPAGKEWVIRGGGWKSNPEKTRSAERDANKPSGRQKVIGFRVVLEVDTSKAK